MTSEQWTKVKLNEYAAVQTKGIQADRPMINDQFKARGTSLACNIRVKIIQLQVSRDRQTDQQPMDEIQTE